MHERYQSLYQELLATLRHLTDGGPINSGAHIGATSVSELAAQSALDLMVVVEPFPLTEAQMAALQTLGSRPDEPAPWSKAQSFVHDDAHQLFVHH